MRTDNRLRVGTVAGGVALIVAAICIVAWGLPFLGLRGPLVWLSVVIAVSLAIGGVFFILIAVLDDTRTRHPLVHSEIFCSTASADDVREVIAGYILEVDGRLITANGSIEATFGSQLALRLMGVMTRFGVDRLPYRLTAHVTESARGVQVALSFTSDEGWYIGRLTVAERAYNARFTYVTKVLQSRLRPENYAE